MAQHVHLLPAPLVALAQIADRDQVTHSHPSPAVRAATVTIGPSSRCERLYSTPRALRRCVMLVSDAYRSLFHTLIQLRLQLL